ncbi:MAG: hypothetical protein R3Y63_12730 [Eubacteriales bacterium]
MADFWTPFTQKLHFWIEYEKNLPQIPLLGNEMFFDEYRKYHDLDCRLTGGDLRADTIFSLWLPLRYTLVSLHTLPVLQENFGKVAKRQDFLQKLLNRGLAEFLPEESPVVQALQELFIRGQGRENVMILINRGINGKRGNPPYFDYMPYFLRECFAGGDFAQLFNRDEQIVRSWMMREELGMFFHDDYLVPEEIIDLAGTGDLAQGHPMEGKTGEEAILAVTEMIQKYNLILEERRKRLFGTA